MKTLEELIPQMSARSVVLSLLLGMRSGSLPVSSIIKVIKPLGFSAPALRTALSRMVANDDLDASGGVYTLAQRHQIRRGVQEERVNPELLVGGTGWKMAVITVAGRDAPSRAATREVLREHRYAELCNGVWLRPDNLAKSLPPMSEIQVFQAQHADEHKLVAYLWDLPAWAAEADLIIKALDPENEPSARFAAAAAAVRHLRSGPVLPAHLQPNNWPAKRLRNKYENYRHYIAQLASERIEDL
ncbi:hypothetical protein FE848_18050 [Marinobacter sp. 1-3A]|uniref:hypothetical protein n=1 Tax=Marinobacter sp. 1-3A TaxID=2582920 RepID=UPI0019083B55|nr:hypothetical protein [Marinobacter sp. 1-3A]MBK1875132.1 hypothetical protein [Marinobacter sp. 1-3A]